MVAGDGEVAGAASFAPGALEACGIAPDEPPPVAAPVIVGAAVEAVPAGAVPGAVLAGAAFAPAAAPLFWLAVAVVSDEVADWLVVGVPAPVVAPAGADWLVAVAAALFDPPLTEGAVAPAGAPAPLLDPAGTVEAVVAGAALGWVVALSRGFWLLLPKPRTTAATMIATTATPSHTERFTEPRNRPVACL